MKDYRKIMRAKREAKGLSQHKLAQQLGITQTFLSEIERGRKNLRGAGHPDVSRGGIGCPARRAGQTHTICTEVTI